MIECVSAASLECALTYGGICVPGICAQSAAQATTGLDSGFMDISLSFLDPSILISFTLLVPGFFFFFLHFSSSLHTCTPPLFPPALPITTLAISLSSNLSTHRFLYSSLSLCLGVIYGTSRCARQGAGGGGLQTMFLMSVWVCWKSGA